MVGARTAGGAAGGVDAPAGHGTAPAAGGSAPDMMGPVIPDDDIPF